MLRFMVTFWERHWRGVNLPSLWNPHLLGYECLVGRQAFNAKLTNARYLAQHHWNIPRYGLRTIS